MENKWIHIYVAITSEAKSIKLIPRVNNIMYACYCLYIAINTIIIVFTTQYVDYLVDWKFMCNHLWFNRPRYGCRFDRGRFCFK